MLLVTFLLCRQACTELIHSIATFMMLRDCHELLHVVQRPLISLRALKCLRNAKSQPANPTAFISWATSTCVQNVQSARIFRHSALRLLTTPCHCFVQRQRSTGLVYKSSFPLVVSFFIIAFRIRNPQHTNPLKPVSQHYSIQSNLVESQIGEGQHVG
jgi:hypothetical protein